jgi:hypothetical protein
MRSFWLVAKHEYLHTAVRRGFVISTAAIPLGMIALIAMVILAENLTKNNAPLGYVDQAGILDAGLYATLPDAGKRAELRAFADQETARSRPFLSCRPAIRRRCIPNSTTWTSGPMGTPGQTWTTWYVSASPPRCLKRSNTG